jgi:hypothetical protein
MTDTSVNRRYSLTKEQIETLFLCRDCRVDTNTIDEYYMVRDEVWAAAGGKPSVTGALTNDMLCVACLERRLGRQLNPKDFILAEANIMHPKSPRLRSRMLGTNELFHGYEIGERTEPG